ncbi:MAG TPA: hypothetical protein VI776_17000, partial [Anaerolineales bacterium]|nr:hypothetical protein [Anaerolineales bacterium]
MYDNFNSLNQNHQTNIRRVVMVASVMVLGVLLVNLLATACGLPPVLSTPVETARVVQDELQNPTDSIPEITPRTALSGESAPSAKE